MPYKATSEILSESEIRELARREIESVYTPSSVYRLQLNYRFSFRDATRLIPYLRELGVDALYLSPYFQSTPKCLHGYNVTDSNKINPEIGSEQDFESFCVALKRAGINQVLDVVPNHMGISGTKNWLWLDVLENGPSSPYARFFDIDWEPEKKELKDKVLLPILGDHYGKVLENQEIRLTSSRGQFWIKYWEHTLPITSKTYALILGHRLDEDLISKFQATEEDRRDLETVVRAFQDLPIKVAPDPQAIEEVRQKKKDARDWFQKITTRSPAIRAFVTDRVARFNGSKGAQNSFNLLDELLAQQFYRMAHWRVAADEINYRRFFNVNELAALRIEDQQVFDHYHELTLQLLRDGKIQGLRIDHPDGLYDPPEYFMRLSRENLFQKVFLRATKRRKAVLKDKKKRDLLAADIRMVVEEEEFSKTPSLYVIAEKILDRQEPLPVDWVIHGTTGYDFLNSLNGIFVDRHQEARMSQAYQQFTGTQVDFEDLLYQKKKFFGLIHMSSEINSLGHRLDQISERDRRYRDFTLHNLTVAIRETIACFPVYRTYITPKDTEVSERDQRYINAAIEKAKRKTPALDPAHYDYLQDILLLNLDARLDEHERDRYRDFVLRFQQLAAPIMAKGLEDTAFYIYHRLISLNEVGGDPTHFGNSRTNFHRQNLERVQTWPKTLITSTTHDTKRSEDVRMRINVLSEMPDEWNKNIESWARVNEKHKTVVDQALQPTRDTEYLIYQTLVGMWPNEGVQGNWSLFQDRIWEFALKAVREARLHTNWLSPNETYEAAVRKFLFSILSLDDGNDFVNLFSVFQQKITRFGMLGSLSSTVLRAGSPGVVDVYQGSEIENLRLVDPDNRGPVDFSLRKRCLTEMRNHVLGGRSPRDIAECLYANNLSQLKLFLTWRGLRFRKSNSDLFLKGAYIPLKTDGPRARNVVSFLRKDVDEILLVAATRFFIELDPEGNKLPIGESAWQDTNILLPKDFGETALRDVFTDRLATIRNDNGILSIPASDVFDSISVAMLTNVR